VDSITNARSTALKGKPPTLESRMMIIEKRLGELEQENTEKKDTIVVLDSTNRSLESNIKDKESAVNILSEEIENAKKKLRYHSSLIYKSHQNKSQCYQTIS